MTDQLDRAAEVLEAHEVVFIDHEVGYECGCNEHGDGHPDGLPFLTDALKHQVRALDKAGLLTSPERDAEIREAARAEALAGFVEERRTREDGYAGAAWDTTGRTQTTTTFMRPGTRERRLVGPWEPCESDAQPTEGETDE